MQTNADTDIKTLAFSGGCHWCTEAVFQSLKGVISVKQGWAAAPDAPDDDFAEAALVEFNPGIIPMEILIEIHLRTHASTSAHQLRERYRSAVYTTSPEDSETARTALEKLRSGFEKPLMTQVLGLSEFKMSREELLNYYYSDRDKPFCRNYIDPKLMLLKKEFRNFVDLGKTDVCD